MGYDQGWIDALTWVQERADSPALAHVLAYELARRGHQAELARRRHVHPQPAPGTTPPAENPHDGAEPAE